MVRPRRHSVFSLIDRPLILWDEPAQVRGAAERLWKRLEQTTASAAYDPAGVFFSWEDLEGQAADVPHIALEELEVIAGRDDGRLVTSRRARRWPFTATCRWPSRRRAIW